MESSLPTALRRDLAVQAASEPHLGSGQNAPAQIRWLRQDLASLTETVSDLAAARARILTLLQQPAVNPHATASVFDELPQPSATRGGNFDPPDALVGPIFTKEATFAPVLPAEGLRKATSHTSTPRPRPPAAALPRGCANGLVAIGLTLILVAILFTIA